MDSLTTLIVKRLAFGVLTLFVISVLIAVGVDFLPGDLAEAILGQSATPESVAALRLNLGLDQPLYVRYFDWLGNIMQWDLGTSLANKREVTELIGKCLRRPIVGIVVDHNNLDRAIVGRIPDGTDTLAGQFTDVIGNNDDR